MKVLLAIDGSQCSDEATDQISDRPWPEGSEVKVLSAFELPLPPTPEGWALPASYLDEMDRVARDHAKAVVERAERKLKSKLDKAVTISSEFLPGPSRTVILDEAEKWNADLIVVGSHGYRAWERFLLGSVSQSVVAHAKCSVEVVRCRKTGAPARQPETGGDKRQ